MGQPLPLDLPYTCLHGPVSTCQSPSSVAACLGGVSVSHPGRGTIIPPAPAAKKGHRARARLGQGPPGGRTPEGTHSAPGALLGWCAGRREGPRRPRGQLGLHNILSHRRPASVRRCRVKCPVCGQLSLSRSRCHSLSRSLSLSLSLPFLPYQDYIECAKTHRQRRDQASLMGARKKRWPAASQCSAAVGF